MAASARRPPPWVAMLPRSMTPAGRPIVLLKERWLLSLRMTLPSSAFSSLVSSWSKLSADAFSSTSTLSWSLVRRGVRGDEVLVVLHDVHPGPLALLLAGPCFCGAARWLEEGELVGKGKEAVVEDVAGDRGAHAVVVVVGGVLSVVGGRSVSVLVDCFVRIMIPLARPKAYKYPSRQILCLDVSRSSPVASAKTESIFPAFSRSRWKILKTL